MIFILDVLFVRYSILDASYNFIVDCVVIFYNLEHLCNDL